MDAFIARLQAFVFTLGIVGIMFAILFFSTIRYKLRANKLGVKASWGQVLGQRLRKTLNNEILEAAALAVKEGLKIDIRQLETHYLSGGNPYKVVKGIVNSRKKGNAIAYNRAAALDLAGRDITHDEINKLYQGS